MPAQLIRRLDKCLKTQLRHGPAPDNQRTYFLPYTGNLTTRKLDDLAEVFANNVANFPYDQALREHVTAISRQVKLVGGKPVLVVASGDVRVKSGLLKQATGWSGQVRLPAPEEVVRYTGYPPGAVSPFLLPQGLPVLLDAPTPLAGRVAKPVIDE